MTLAEKSAAGASNNWLENENRVRAVVAAALVKGTIGRGNAHYGLTVEEYLAQPLPPFHSTRSVVINATPPAARRSGTGALELTGVTAAVSPLRGGCGTKFVFTGKLAVGRGAGPYTFEWIKPDGQTTDPTTAMAGLGNPYQPSLEYTLRGPGHLSGDAVLRVIKPAELRSAPVHIDYVC